MFNPPCCLDWWCVDEGSIILKYGILRLNLYICSSHRCIQEERGDKSEGAGREKGGSGKIREGSGREGEGLRKRREGSGRENEGLGKIREGSGREGRVRKRRGTG